MSKVDISNVFELEHRIYKFIKFGMNKESIIRKIKTLQLAPEFKVDIDVIVNSVCDDYPDYDLIQFFMDSKIIVDARAEHNLLYMYNVKQHELQEIDRNVLSSIIDSKLSWDNRRYSCYFIYNPYEPFKVRKSESRIWEFNSYVPPFWQEDYFYSEGRITIPKINELPKVYDKYLNHLVSGDEDSLNYMLDWTANAIKNRNYCILTTIGKQGIGKGVFGEILNQLVGVHNFSKTDNKVVSKDFNAQIADKRMVYLDEMKIKTVEQESKLKDLVNDNIEIEKKGVDAKLSTNYSNFYFSSNYFDSVRITDDDRRFSLVNLTDVKLKDVMEKDEISSLMEEDNIRQLAYYLWHREIDQNKMLNKFVCEYLTKLRDSTRKPWHDFFILDYAVQNKGKTVTIKEAKEAINEFMDDVNSYGRKSLTLLSEEYTEVFKVHNTNHNGKRQWCVTFYKDWE